MKPRAVAYAFFACMLVIHGAVAWVTPLQGDDWSHLVWSRLHATSFLAEHYAFSDLVGFVLARSTIVHTIVSPIAGLALLVGVFAIAARRLPRLDSWLDVGALIVMSAFLWITAARAGLVWFHRPYTATWIYGSAVTLWFLAPYRCRWEPRGIGLALVALGGYCAGTSSRQLAVIALVGAIAGLYRTRARWMWLGLAGIAIGTVAGFLDPPYVDFKGWKPGFEASLAALGLSAHEGGELISLVIGLVMIRIVLARVRPRWAGEAPVPDTGETMRWLWFWLAATALALFGPRYSEATLLPAALVLVIASLPYIEWLLASPALRVVLGVLAGGVHLTVWAIALATYVPLGAEFRARIATLEAAPAGSVPVIEPYRDVNANAWTFGEDLAEAASRQLIAIELYDLRDIELARPFGRLEHNPHLTIRFDSDDLTADELAAARAPRYWATDPVTARRQLQTLADNLHAQIDHPFHAQLVVTDYAPDILRGRPLVVADSDVKLRVTRTRPDDYNEQAVALRPAEFHAAQPEAYIVVGTHGEPATIKAGKYMVPVMTTALHAVIACNPTRCFLIDAFIPVL